MCGMYHSPLRQYTYIYIYMLVPWFYIFCSLIFTVAAAFCFSHVYMYTRSTCWPFTHSDRSNFSCWTTSMCFVHGSIRHHYYCREPTHKKGKPRGTHVHTYIHVCTRIEAGVLDPSTSQQAMIVGGLFFQRFLDRKKNNNELRKRCLHRKAQHTWYIHTCIYIYLYIYIRGAFRIYPPDHSTNINAVLLPK